MNVLFSENRKYSAIMQLENIIKYLKKGMYDLLNPWWIKFREREREIERKKVLIYNPFILLFYFSHLRVKSF